MRRDKQLVLEFVQAYNCAYGSSFSIESWPEDECRNTPAVEAIARQGNQRMAIEHTLAQPFVDEREDSAIFRRVMAPIETDESLLLEGYDVTVTINVGGIPKGVDWGTALGLIREWLSRELPSLPDGRTRIWCRNLLLSSNYSLRKHWMTRRDFRDPCLLCATRLKTPCTMYSKRRYDRNCQSCEGRART